MNYEETLKYIHCGFFHGTRPGLERVGELLSRLGDPQKDLRFIHVAGTNGKGSFCAMCDSVLRAAGYHTGLYTSPYIERFNERMAVDGIPISDDELVEIAGIVRPAAEAMDDRPTEFELIAAVAMLYFKRHECDPVVLEVGMGGRLDATNIIRDPLLSVITGISLDHTAILGDTVEKIAAEKAGIIKDGAPVLYGGTDPAALEVIKKTALDRGSEFSFVDQESVIIENTSIHGSDFTFDGGRYHIGLLGTYQPHNAANVVAAVKILRTRGLNIPDAALDEGLRSARWKGRFEKLADDPLFIIDGSHNPEGIEAAIKSIKALFGDRKVCLITGVLKDKDYPAMARALSEVAAAVFTLRPDNPDRALDPALYADEFGKNGVVAYPGQTIPEAINAAVTYAKENELAIVALGSLYMYSDVKHAFLK